MKCFKKKIKIKLKKIQQTANNVYYYQHNLLTQYNKDKNSLVTLQSEPEDTNTAEDCYINASYLTVYNNSNYCLSFFLTF